jgi:UPF0755 protein
MKRALKRLFWICFFLPIPVLAVVGGLLSELQYPYYNADEEETFVYIPPGANAAKVTELLKEQGLLHTKLPFRLWLRRHGLDRSLKAGEYRFAGGSTPIEIAERLSRGDIYFRSITIAEGLTALETTELLARGGFGDREKLQALLLRTDLIKDLNPSAQNLEGYLFPETYRFGRRDEEETVIRAMVDQFRNRMDVILKESPLPGGWTAARIVTLASMIEKEVKMPSEQPVVASVLVNRLRLNMTLGVDATIIYAMKLAGTWGGNIRRSDLQMKSPYNTYINRDLPPGPICNPGERAIRAALNPEKTDYLYYVSKNDGTHQFSKDLRSHNNAVNLYQRSGRF